MNILTYIFCREGRDDTEVENGIFPILLGTMGTAIIDLLHNFLCDSCCHSEGFSY